MIGPRPAASREEREPQDLRPHRAGDALDPLLQVVAAFTNESREWVAAGAHDFSGACGRAVLPCWCRSNRGERFRSCPYRLGIVGRPHVGHRSCQPRSDDRAAMLPGSAT
jgi:hypothetical protein